ncbi:carboxylesterase family protein [Paenarthrobacter sp. NPDC089316]|uniref:carboxylesterase/lipase family protein n=1 Tax=unclassified Paenarthrobacter TaxID=2634190 RepID=UPI003445BF9B
MSSPLAYTRYGTVAGLWRDGAARFYGVPYAAAPVGPLRFAPPRPPVPWSRIRNSTEPAPVAPQPAGPLADPHRGMSEDCLTVDIVTPTMTGGHPVLVWLHGGGYFAGSSIEPDTDGGQLAATYGTVVVSITHRLGLLGFLDLEDSGVPGSGNAGLLDIVAALRWIHENIASFGGDPSRITVAGHSGGGGKTSMIMSMPAAKGLINGAVVMAGPEFDLNTVQRARTTLLGTLATLGISRCASGTLKRLRDVPLTDLLQAQEQLGVGAVPGPDSMRFSPVIGRSVLPLSPSQAFSTGASAKVPMILGTARDEAHIGVRPTPGVPVPTLSEVQLLGLLADGLDHPKDAEKIVSRYRALHPRFPNRDLFLGIASDQFRIRTLRMAEARLQGGAERTYVYRYDASGREAVASHGAEVASFFALRGEPDGLATALVAFARDGRPPSHWPPYTIEARHELRVSNDCIAAVPDPDAPSRSAWKGVSTGPGSNPWARLIQSSL